MKRLLILGSNGLLGQSLVKRFNDDYKVSASSIEQSSEAGPFPVIYNQADLTNRYQVNTLIEETQPQIIINAAGLADAERCEEDSVLCWNRNVRIIENIIEYSTSLKPILVQFSTATVFDGMNGPYGETDPPNPSGNLARSKMAAENIIRESELEYLIIRTNMLYGPKGSDAGNFVQTLLERLRENQPVPVPRDQIINPTLVDDVSEAVFQLLDKKEYGLYHVVGPTRCSLYEFAVRIAETFQLDQSLIQPLSLAEMQQKAQFPYDSSLKTDKLVNRLRWEPHSLEDGLKILQKGMTV